MTRDELLARLLALADNDDHERSHWLADLALLTYVGDAEISTAYSALERWYA